MQVYSQKMMGISLPGIHLHDERPEGK